MKSNFFTLRKFQKSILSCINFCLLLLMKVKEIIKLIEDGGWRLRRTKGSHRQYKHSTKKGLVTVAGHLSDEWAPKTIKSIFKQAGFNNE